MGSGARAERIALGQTRGESLGIQEHEKAMIPILREQAEMEIELKGKAFTQDIEQTKELYLLAKRFEDQGKTQQQPTFVSTTAPAAGTKSPNIMLYIGLAILVWYFWKGK